MNRDQTRLLKILSSLMLFENESLIKSLPRERSKAFLKSLLLLIPVPWCLIPFLSFSSLPSLGHIFATPWVTARQASLSITNSHAIQPSHSVVPFPFCPQSLPASGSFPMSQLFAWGGQSTGVSASASVLPMNTQDWSLLGWTGWISLQSKGLSRVFSNTTVQKHQFFSTQLSSQSNSHIHTWPMEKPYPWLDGPLLAK